MELIYLQLLLKAIDLGVRIAKSSNASAEDLEEYITLRNEVRKALVAKANDLPNADRDVVLAEVEDSQPDAEGTSDATSPPSH